MGERSLDAVHELCAIARDIGDRADPAGVLVVIGAPTYAAAIEALSVLSSHPDLEIGPVPLQSDAVTIVRIDAPLAGRPDTRRNCDEALLGEIAEAQAPSSLADIAARSALLPTDGRGRGRLVRLAALSPTWSDHFAAARRVVERTVIDPWSGTVQRRALQLGVASQSVAHAALSAGLVGELSRCMRHELSLLVAEWEGWYERTHSARIADIARGQLVELINALHPRAAVLANAELERHLAAVSGDLAESAAVGETLHGPALGVGFGGTVYSRDGAADNVPLGFVLRGGNADLYLLVDTCTGSGPLRKPVAPYLELVWRTPDDREAALGVAAIMLAALHDAVRRWPRESVGRAAQRESRVTYCALVDISLEARLTPEWIRLVIPLREGLAEIDAHKAGVDLVAHLADASSTNPTTEWTAQAILDTRTASPIALAGPLLLRDFFHRWTRALRLFPRYFPDSAPRQTALMRGRRRS